MKSRRIVKLLSPVFLFIAMIQLSVSAAVAQSTTVQDDSADDLQQVVMRTTLGDITLELDAERAPQSVENFLAYVDDNFYANTLFHRVIEGFMIQGGGFSSEYNRKTTLPPVSNEAYNGLRNQRYTIAMARTTAPHSATSQFFINAADNGNLDHTGTTQRGWGYTVFGKVIDGQEVVDAISIVDTAAGGPFSRDVPKEPVVILGVDRIASNSVTPDNSTINPDNEVTGDADDQATPAAARPTEKLLQDAPASGRKFGLDIPRDEDSVSSDIIKQN